MMRYLLYYSIPRKIKPIWSLDNPDPLHKTPLNLTALFQSAVVLARFDEILCKTHHPISYCFMCW